MNYSRLYDKIIQHRLNNPVIGYKEKHHIIPRSLGGTDDPSNIVELTGREHFICHYLLVKSYDSSSFEWHKMNNAFLMMKVSSTTQERYFNSRLYEYLRINFSHIMSYNQTGEKNSQYGTRWVFNRDLEISKKVPRSSKLEPGWELGRKITNWVEEDIYCAECNDLIVHTGTKFCSISCSSRFTNRLKFPEFYKRLPEMVLDYNNGTAISRCLINVGLCGTGRNFSRLKQILGDGEMVAAPGFELGT